MFIDGLLMLQEIIPEVVNFCRELSQIREASGLSNDGNESIEVDDFESSRSVRRRHETTTDHCHRALARQ